MSKPTNNSTKTPIFHRLAPYCYKLLIQLITSTCRIKVHGKQHLTQLQNSGSNQSWIYSIWHNNVLISPWALKNQGVTVMISESKDGEIIARSVKLFGNETIRGSSSKNSTKVTRLALKVLKNLKPIAITPDGPRGPKYELQEGVLYLAALSNTPIIPFHIECTRQWEFNSWDKLKLPKPFSTIHCCYGAPIEINKQEIQSNKETIRNHVLQLMNDNVEYAIKQKKLKANSNGQNQ